MKIGFDKMVLYISQRISGNAAAEVHMKAVQAIHGSENIYVINLGLVEPEKRFQYIAFGRPRNKWDTLKRWIQGNTVYVANNSIREIVCLVKTHGIQLVYIEDSFFGNVACQLKKHCPSVKIVTFFHDIGADLFPKSRKESTIPNKIEYTFKLKQEKKQLRYSDVNIVFSKRDADLFRKHYRREPEAIIPLAVPEIPCDRSRSGEKCKDGNTKLLFVGNKYWPNIVGIRWFYEKVLPQLPQNVEVFVVGRGTEFLAQEFTDPRMKVIGGVESLADYYQNSDIVIVPIFDGGGMKMKTAEALSAGKCIVATEEGFSGYWENISQNLKNQVLFKCDTDNEWVSVLNRLVAEGVERYHDAVYRDYLSHNSLDATEGMLRRVLKSYVEIGHERRE